MTVGPAPSQLLAAELRALGYDVIEAGDATQALASTHEADGPIDLVLTDIVMPGLRGTDLVNRLREVHPALGIIYMSGYTDDAVLAGVEESGEPFISKPYAVNQVTRLVREELNRCGRQNSPSSHTA